MYSRIGRLALMVALLLAIGGASQGVFAQDVTASISGFVTDSSGAAVSGASVTVNNFATGEQRKTTTDENGQFRVPGLPIGTYTVFIEAKGFKKYVQENIVLHVNDKTPVNVALETGNVQESVTVTAGAPLVKTETHTVEGLLTGEQIREMPLNNRNFAQLTQVVPGVSSTQGSTVSFGGLSTVAISVNGGRTTAINWSIDGARNVDTGSNNTLFNYPSVDAIAEFKILTNSYDAQFGRNAGGVVNVVTRSGTREFHGGVYEFIRNDVLQARNPFQTTPLRGLSNNRCFGEANPENDPECVYKGPLRYNNFGYNVGGPVWIPKLYSRGHDKTFFFFSEEWRRQRGVAVLSGLYPTEAQRAGIFATPIKDPTTGQNFQNNQIPDNRIDANAKAIMANFMPLPNSPSEGINNFRTVGSSPFDFRQELVRVDHAFNDNWRIYGRYVHDITSTVETGGLFNNLVFPGVSTTATSSPADNVVIRLSTVISPTLLNEVGYDFARNAISSVLTGNSLRSNFSDINIPEIFAGSPSGALPAIAITGFSAPLGVLAPFQNDNPSHTFSDNLTWSRGAHTLKVGGLISYEGKNENSQGGATPGSFTFDGTATGNAIADFLLGRAKTYVEDQTDVTVHERFWTFEWYAQDSWKARRNLTIDLGLRHSIFLNPYDTEDLLTSFLPRLFDPAKAVRLAANGTVIPGSGDRFNGIIFANDNSPYGKYVQTNHYNTIGPRVGFAWDPFSDGKMAVRGGFGLYYDRSLIGIVEQNAFSDPKANQRASIDNTFLSNPTGGAANNSIFPLGLTATGDPFKVPTVIQWSLGIQRELTKDMVAEITYAGSHGYHLLHQFQLNQPRPGEAARQGVGLNFVRPYIGFGSINDRETTANSSYNSLQASFRKRLSRGLLFYTSYTFARTLTDSSDDRGNTPQDVLNYKLEKGPASFQRTHVFNMSYLWEVPFPKDAPYHLNWFLGGWQVAGATFFWSGLPLTVTQGGDFLGTGGNTRPNLIADPKGPETVAQWFNTAAFAAATTTFGTAGRGIIIGPGVNNWDISLVKNFRWHENLRVRFSTDFVNAFNHQNPGNPNVAPTYNATTLVQTNTNFGRITALARDPRIIQFGLKFNF
jgi:Carboxypeptidase regulatory-like domain/TonB-dependent Receptor Plug Domain